MSFLVSTLSFISSLPLQGYGHLLEEAGFEAVNAQDRTEQFTAILRSEVDKFLGKKEEFLEVTASIALPHPLTLLTVIGSLYITAPLANVCVAWSSTVVYLR